ncbi:hypothetical protein G9A89_000962 [Geosiphon pyriformis]|nr:hypothetical protein G9A89_000962 [Geosiphon pyriformis]
MIKQIGLSVSNFGSVLAGLETQSSNKKKTHIESIYSHSPSFKKTKKPKTSNVMVNLLAGSLSVNILQAIGVKCTRSWDNEIDSKKNSISKVLDVENIKNTIAKEMSYIDSNASEIDDIIDDTTSKKTQMRTYVLRQLPKVLSFNTLSNNGAKLVLSALLQVIIWDLKSNNKLITWCLINVIILVSEGVFV